MGSSIRLLVGNILRYAFGQRPGRLDFPKPIGNEHLGLLCDRTRSKAFARHTNSAPKPGRRRYQRTTKSQSSRSRGLSINNAPRQHTSFSLHYPGHKTRGFYARINVKDKAAFFEPEYLPDLR
jgi:hypothetical protein